MYSILYKDRNNQPWIDASYLIQWNLTSQKEHSVSHQYIKTSRYVKTCWNWLLRLYFSVSSVQLSAYSWIWVSQRILWFNPSKQEIYISDKMKHSALYKTIPCDQTCLCELWTWHCCQTPTENQWSIKTEEAKQPK